MVAIGDDVKQYLDFGRPNTAPHVGGMGGARKKFLQFSSPTIRF